MSDIDFLFIKTNKYNYNEELRDGNNCSDISITKKKIKNLLKTEKSKNLAKLIMTLNINNAFRVGFSFLKVEISLLTYKKLLSNY